MKKEPFLTFCTTGTSLPHLVSPLYTILFHENNTKLRRSGLEEAGRPWVQRLRLQASTAGGAGWTLGGGTKIPHATLHGHKKIKKLEEAFNVLLHMWSTET